MALLFVSILMLIIISFINSRSSVGDVLRNNLKGMK